MNAPKFIEVSPDSIPSELKALRQWACWKPVYVEGKEDPWSKPPFNPNTNHHASSTDPTTWVPFDVAYAAVVGGRYTGVSLALTRGIFGGDLDHCLKDGKIAPADQEIIDSLATYTELSPSGEGVRLLCYATVNECYVGDGVEFYGEAKFLTITGEVIGTHPNLEQRQEIVDEWMEYFREGSAGIEGEGVEGEGFLDDCDVKAALFREEEKGNQWFKVFHGRWNTYYRSQSSADMAIIKKLCYYCNNDAVQIDRIFRTSGLFRDKCDEKHFRGGVFYLEGSITKGIASQTETHLSYYPRYQHTTGEIEAAFNAFEPFLLKKNNNSTTDDNQNETLVTKKEPTMHKKRAFFPSEFLALPRAKYLASKHIIERALSMVYGQSGAGKSFFALDLAFSIGLGKPLFGIFKTQQAPVLYLVSESDGSFAPRMLAYAKHHAIDLDAIRNMAFLPEAFNFQDTSAVTTQIAAIIREDLIVNPGLIVIDTLNRNIHGDENNPKDMGGFINTCEVIRKIFNCAVLIVHHSGKEDSRGARGHSSLIAACDTIIKIDSTPTSETAVVYSEKVKNGKPFGSYTLAKKVVELDLTDEDNPDSVVLVPIGETIAEDVKMAAFVELFPVGQEKAEILRDVMSGDKNTLKRIGWNLKKTWQDKATEAVMSDALSVHEEDRGKKGIAYRYFRKA